LVFRLSIRLAPAIFAAAAFAQYPDNPGKAEAVKACKECHEIERSFSLKQDRAGWQATLDKMLAVGAPISDRDYTIILDYLAKSFPAEELPKLNVNKAGAIDFESRLSLPRSQAAAVIEYRTRNGPFKTIEDLKKVPGVDVAKIEAKKDKLAF
jgi:competence protein ComEA